MSKTLHQQLVELRGRAKAWLDGENPEGFCPVHGICPNMEKELEKPLHDLTERWPGASGYRGFPVPHPTEAPSDGYVEAKPQEMWSPAYEYARNRWALLEWLIEQTASESDQPVVDDCVEVKE